MGREDPQVDQNQNLQPLDIRSTESYPLVPTCAHFLSCAKDKDLKLVVTTKDWD